MDIFYTIKWISRNFIFFLIIGLAAESAITKIRVRRSSALPTKVPVLCDKIMLSCPTYKREFAEAGKTHSRSCNKKQRKRYHEIRNYCRKIRKPTEPEKTTKKQLVG
ncbi:unnamed protein product [Clavelina lepadiformis]|uniref:Secreted protein n=1 Tax=Clavelina lepadiformis TaxID=159417 RepID=A0ABP0F475_CLALP